ncbi:hypothetical protein [Rhodococcus sp. 06-418-5]|uniref:hypothetical protein n=1 Tax=Rhodococcus sp. 06-418-5 TaxID=2022507 RepID=UPI00117993CB|nr:hypothetical protein [Rhodococcus sp. 06-418-5]
MAAHGHSIVSNAEIREMIGPSREVDDCPQCKETVAWERNDYDMRDNDDRRYSWRAYCETCNLDLELMPWPNPPVAGAVSATHEEPVDVNETAGQYMHRTGDIPPWFTAAPVVEGDTNG